MAPAPGRKGTRARALLVGLAAFIGFGGWAVFANRDHPTSDMIRAGIAQGSFSFLSTTCSVLVLEFLYRLGRTPGQKLALAILGTPTIIMGSMTIGHIINKTPNVFVTLIPSYISAGVFVVVYSLNLHRLSKRDHMSGSENSG
jgi:hypothetical protein